jgi:hypothetical protein
MEFDANVNQDWNWTNTKLSFIDDFFLSFHLPIWALLAMNYVKRQLD